MKNMSVQSIIRGTLVCFFTKNIRFVLNRKKQEKIKFKNEYRDYFVNISNRLHQTLKLTIDEVLELSVFINNGWIDSNTFKLEKYINGINIYYVLLKDRDNEFVLYDNDLVDIRFIVNQIEF
jgi:hypothetical protein